jgi:glycosidase
MRSMRSGESSAKANWQPYSRCCYYSVNHEFGSKADFKALVMRPMPGACA